MNAVGYLIGAGSMSIGVEQAGFTIDTVFETPGYSKNAVSWDLNRPDNKHRVLDFDIESAIPDSRGADLIFGNPPCGGMSNITGCHVDSETNNCMIKWMQMAINTRPRMILMENAYQIATKSGTPLREQLFRMLQDKGYKFWTWLFYSWQVGCPQNRRRMFVCATLDDIRNPDILTLEDLPQSDQHITCMNWLWDLEDVAPSKEPVQSTLGHYVTHHSYDNTGTLVTEYLMKASQTEFRRATNVNFMTPRQAEKWMSGTEKEKADYERRLREGLYWEDCPKVFQGMQQFRRPNQAPLFGAVPTVLSDFRIVHPTRQRLITMREQARLMGYPDTWEFHKCAANLTAQGVPAMNSRWAAERLCRVTSFMSPYV